MWKPTQQEALWFHGGNLHQSRHYSQFLSLQLKAAMEGIADAGLRPGRGEPSGRSSATTIELVKAGGDHGGSCGR